MKLLGIDYGGKRVGLSLSSDGLALPWRILINQGVSGLVQELVAIIKNEKIDKVVVGWPLGLKGNKTNQTREVENFFQILKNGVKLPVVKADERFSTQLAHQQGGKDDDAQAAANILQSYLDRVEDSGSRV